MRQQLSVDLVLFSIILFGLFAIVLYFGALLLSKFLQVKDGSGKKLHSYECGEDSIGTTNIPINIKFFLVALLFLVFEAEIVLLAPVLTLFSKYKTTIASSHLLLAVLFFVFVLVWGFAYCWHRGDLSWYKYKGRKE